MEAAFDDVKKQLFNQLHDVVRAKIFHVRAPSARPRRLVARLLGRNALSDPRWSSEVSPAWKGGGRQRRRAGALSEATPPGPLCCRTGRRSCRRRRR